MTSFMQYHHAAPPPTMLFKKRSVASMSSSLSQSSMSLRSDFSVLRTHRSAAMPSKHLVPRWLLFQGSLMISICILYHLFSSGAYHTIFESSDPTLYCEQPNYTVRLLSYDPLMIHVENFISAKERRHLLNIAYVEPEGHDLYLIFIEYS